MSKISKVKSYLTSQTKCFVPLCKARCCTNAPLPEDFLPKFKGQIQRNIYSAVNIGLNDPRDTFNSVVYNTIKNPIQLVGRDQKGEPVYGILPSVVKELQIKSQAQIDELMKNFDPYQNYCPFITDYGRCSVYEHRPTICKDFGSTGLKIDICSDKSSRLDIAKFYTSKFFDFKGMFKFYKDLIKNLFS